MQELCPVGMIGCRLLHFLLKPRLGIAWSTSFNKRRLGLDVLVLGESTIAVVCIIFGRLVCALVIKLCSILFFISIFFPEQKKKRRRETENNDLLNQDGTPYWEGVFHVD